MEQQAWPDSIDVFFPPLIQARLRHDVFSGSFGTQKISSHQSHQSCPAWPSPQSSQDPIWNIRSVTGLRPSAAARSCGACLSPWITEAAVARQHNNQKKKDNFENTTSERIASFQMLQWNTQEIDLTLHTWKPVEDRIFIYLLAKAPYIPPTLESNNETKFEACGRNRITSGTSGVALKACGWYRNGPLGPCLAPCARALVSTRTLWSECFTSSSWTTISSSTSTTSTTSKLFSRCPPRFGPPHWPRTWHPRSRCVPKTPLCHSLRPRRLAWPGFLAVKQWTSMQEFDNAPPGW